MELGNTLIKLRKRDKLSQEVLAERLGVTRQTISNWESGTTKPDIYQIKNISKIFNISIDELLDNDVRDIIEKKVSNTEKNINKNTKSIKVIIITLYFIILSLLVGFIIYCLTNKDFTDEYQTEITCTLGDTKLFLEMSSELNKEDVITNYILEIREYSDGHTRASEEYDAGDSIGEAMSSLNAAKKILIRQGAVCK